MDYKYIIVRITWYDFSGYNNDAKIYYLATSATDDSGWHSNYLAFDGIDDLVSKTGITIDGANGTIEVIGKYISGSYIFRSGNRIYIGYNATTKGYPIATTIDFNTFSYNNLSSRVLKYYTENNVSRTLNYYNMNKSEEKIFDGIYNGASFSIGSFTHTNWEQGAKMQVYAVRIYNRALTEDEIRQNYEIDKVRFNIQE